MSYGLLSLRRSLVAVMGTSVFVIACAGGTATEDDACRGAACTSAPPDTNATFGADASTTAPGTTGDDDDASTVINPPDPSDDDAGDDGDDAGASGDWVNMVGNTAGCEQKDGIACGWAATNNGTGNTCACRHGTWSEGWTCETPDAPVTAGASCPGVVGTADASTPILDASTPLPDAATPKPDASTSTAWVDMENNATGCDNHPTAPCGWAAANNNLGYTCACRHGDWADGWTCETANAPKVAGAACP